MQKKGTARNGALNFLEKILAKILPNGFLIFVSPYVARLPRLYYIMPGVDCRKSPFSNKILEALKILHLKKIICCLCLIFFLGFSLFSCQILAK